MTGVCTELGSTFGVETAVDVLQPVCDEQKKRLRPIFH
uniref:Uncharacterized protein n=1 Tax=Arundo donax TaxID=35708 RepID=A0A0A9AC89_ARUDO